MIPAVSFTERIFSLKVVDNSNNKAMAAPAGGHGSGGGGGERVGKGRYGRTFEEESSCKQPLLVKVLTAKYQYMGIMKTAKH